jgi:hypothetical protein
MTTNAKANILLIALIALIIGACSKNDDTAPSPIPDIRDKFVGSWSVNDETCGKGKYLVTMEKDPASPDLVLIYNFGFSNATEADKAIVTGNTITLYKQTNSEGWEIEGVGNYNDAGNINWTYTLLISGTLENCSATYVKN